MGGIKKTGMVLNETFNENEIITIMNNITLSMAMK